MCMHLFFNSMTQNLMCYYQKHANPQESVFLHLPHRGFSFTHRLLVKLLHRTNRVDFFWPQPSRPPITQTESNNCSRYNCTACTKVAPGHKWNLEELMSRIKPLLCSGWREKELEPNLAWAGRHTRLSSIAEEEFPFIWLYSVIRSKEIWHEAALLVFMYLRTKCWGEKRPLQLQQKIKQCVIESH